METVGHSQLEQVQGYKTTVWVDSMRITVRPTERIVTLVFDSVIPEERKLIEAARLQTSFAHLVRIRDALDKIVHDHSMVVPQEKSES